MRSYDFDPSELFEEEDLLMIEKTIKEDNMSQMYSVEEFMELVRSGNL